MTTILRVLVRLDEPKQAAVFVTSLGREVLVSFLPLDQDRPVVTGCVYNVQNPVLHALPGQMERRGLRTQTTPGGGGSNELALDHAAGASCSTCRRGRFDARPPPTSPER